MRKVFVGMATLVVALAIVGGALASGNGASKGVYGTPPGKVQAVVKGAHATLGSKAKSGGSLPFTGLDLGVMVGAGLVLLTIGVSLRRLSRK